MGGKTVNGDGGQLPVPVVPLQVLQEVGEAMLCYPEVL